MIATLLSNPCIDDILNSFQWLNEQELIQSIIKLIDREKNDRDTHDNAARLVIEILRVSRDSQYAPASDRIEDPLLNTLESPETMELLLKIIFGKDVSFHDFHEFSFSIDHHTQNAKICTFYRQMAEILTNRI